jgi:methionyl aminopeptidase
MIVLKTDSQIDKLRKANRLVARYLTMILILVKTTDGITTRMLDRLAEEFANDHGAIPAFKGFKGFPYSICACVNEEVIHGMPNDRPLQEGDILGVDYGILLDGWYGDSAITVAIGEVPETTTKLIKTGQECLYHGIDKFRKGAHLNEISHAIQSHAELNGYNSVRDFVGHGVGRKLHEDPQVFNFTDKPNEGVTMREGIVIAIEPMIVEGSYDLIKDANGWTVRTKDGGLSAHWEHTVALTGKGLEILSLRKGENYPYE